MAWYCRLCTMVTVGTAACQLMYAKVSQCSGITAANKQVAWARRRGRRRASASTGVPGRPPPVAANDRPQDGSRRGTAVCSPNSSGWWRKKRWNGGNTSMTPRKTRSRALSTRAQVAVLHLVQHHETVVLADHVIVGPHPHQQGEVFHRPGQHHRRSDREEEDQAAVKQPGIAARASRSKNVRRGGGENVGAVEAHRPEPPQQRDGHVENGVEQQINVAGAGRCRSPGRDPRRGR